MVEPPSRSEREKCWNARDVYWKCLDENNEDTNKCKKQREFYESNCTSLWVQHFDRRREYLKFKAQLQKGGDSLKDYLESQKEKNK